MEKKCSRCGAVKGLEEFDKRSPPRKTYRGQCKMCCRFISKQRRINKKEQVREWKRNHRLMNLERERERDRVNDHRRRSTPTGKLKNHMIARIWQSLNSSMGGKRWVDLVGYDANELKLHLEKQFTPEMTWENHGTYWEIDHKHPISRFNFKSPDDEDFKKCWALTNLQPLARSENRRKRDRI